MSTQTRTDLLLLVAFCGFLFFYGLGSFGLIGADEPRYAQVAREMLDRGDWITPTLHATPWLEKPPLYYWQAMLAYSIARRSGPGADLPGGGVTDTTARIPSALDAALLVLAAYLFLRRFRPGSEVDGALITAGSAAIIGFARAAATDMPLAAAFGIAMLGWYAWYWEKYRAALAGFYVFIALATLAKGPVAPFFAIVILVVFAFLRNDWLSIRRTLWIPGIVLYFAIALPWYIAVQLRNPQFFRVFILQHNLGRFSENLYHHTQPFWFYLPVLLLALVPWTVWLIAAIAERLRIFWVEKRAAFATSADSFGLFLVIWLLIPVLFFSASQSKLPGYILPAIPAGGLLISEYLALRREERTPMSVFLSAAHAMVCGGLVCAALMAPHVVMYGRIATGTPAYVAGAAGAFVALLIWAALRGRTGHKFLRVATVAVIVISLAAILRLGSAAMDEKLSARPIARTIVAFSHEPIPVAVYGTNREQDYGLEFYLNRTVQRYAFGQVPAQAHVLVAGTNMLPEYGPKLAGRKISFLANVPAQNLEIYYVSAAAPNTP